MKNLFIVSFLSFTFPLFVNAQLSHSNWQIEGSILRGKHIQYDNVVGGIVNKSVSSNDISQHILNSEKNNFVKQDRLQVAIGVRKFDSSGNYDKLRLIAGRSIWDRNTPILLQDTLGEENISVIAPYFVGKVVEHTFGLDYTKSFLMNHNSTVLQLFLGGRASGIFSTGEYESRLPIVNPERRSIFYGELAFAPEALYLFPNNKMTIGLGVILPMASFFVSDHFSTEDLGVEEPFQIGTSGFDFADWSKSRVELTFGWFL